MSNNVELSVRSQLNTIVAELEGIHKKAKEVSDELNKTAEGVEKGVNDKTKSTETMLTRLRKLGGKVADQLRKDFGAMFSTEALRGSLAIQNQFRGTLKQSMSLTDSIRKLGTTFGFSRDQFSSFQSSLQKGLGDIGLSAEAGQKALEGLVETPVRGEKQLLEYTKTAGQLARVTGQQGNEGGIAKGLSGVIQARGGNVNDLSQLKDVAQSVLKVRNATGKGASETLDAMTSIFESMPKDLRKKVSAGTVAELSAAGMAAGPGSTGFLQELMKQSALGRLPTEMQGFGNAIGKNGQVNVQELGKALRNVMGRIPGDPERALQTAGFSEEASKGAVRFVENLDRATRAIDDVRKSSADLAEQDRRSMSLGEAFRANINKILGSAGGVIGGAQNKATDALTNTSQSTWKSAAVVAGGGLLAAVLGGAGLKGIGKALGIGGLAKKGLTESVTGEKVQDVRVINFDEAGGGLGGLGGVAGGAGLLSRAGGALPAVGAGAAGIGIGAVAAYGWQKSVIEPIKKAALQTSTGRAVNDKLTDAMIKVATKLDLLPEIVEANRGPVRDQRVKVELNKRELKESGRPSRGGNYGP